MSKRLFLLLASCSLLLTPSVALAAEVATDSASVSATVPSQAVSPDNDAPTPPILLRPPNERAIGDPRPEFAWKRSTDPNGNTVTYTLYINGIATFLGISDTGNALQSNYTSRIESGEVRLLPRQDFADGTYTWYVVASDPAGNTASSTTWTFIIDTTPPFLTITQIDNYTDLKLSTSNPSTVENASFEIRGPKDIFFRVETEPLALVELQFRTPENELVAITQFKTDHTGVASLTQYLEPGTYKVQAIAVDKAQNTIALPPFTLIITKVVIPIPEIPGIPEAPEEIVIPPLPSIPATISKIEAAPPTAYFLATLALTLLILLIKRRRPNLLLLNDTTGKPIPEATVYHSRPEGNHRLLLTNLPRWMRSYPYWGRRLHPQDRGLLQVPSLARYSTLTIIQPDTTTILSISAKPHRILILTLS